MTVKIKHNKAHVLYKAHGYDHCNFVKCEAPTIDICGRISPLHNELSVFGKLHNSVITVSTKKSLQFDAAN